MSFETPINFSLSTRTPGVSVNKFNLQEFIIPIELDAYTADRIINLANDNATKDPVYGTKKSILYLKYKQVPEEELFSPSNILIEFSVLGTYSKNTIRYLVFKITHLEKQPSQDYMNEDWEEEIMVEEKSRLLN